MYCLNQDSSEGEMGAISNYTGHRHTQAVHLERHVRPPGWGQTDRLSPSAPDQLGAVRESQLLWDLVCSLLKVMSGLSEKDTKRPAQCLACAKCSIVLLCFKLDHHFSTGRFYMCLSTLPVGSRQSEHVIWGPLVSHGGRAISVSLGSIYLLHNTSMLWEVWFYSQSNQIYPVLRRPFSIKIHHVLLRWWGKGNTELIRKWGSLLWCTFPPKLKKLV